MNQCTHVHCFGERDLYIHPSFKDTKRGTDSPKGSEVLLSEEDAVIFQEADPAGC